MNIIKRVIMHPQLLAVLPHEAAVGRKILGRLDEAEISANDPRVGVLARKLLGPDARPRADVEHVARVVVLLAAEWGERQLALEEQQPHLVLEVQAVLLLAIVGEEVLVLAVGVERSAMLFYGQFVGYREGATPRLAAGRSILRTPSSPLPLDRGFPLASWVMPFLAD